ncbi:CaiB/BaiF CoA transferase family protein [Ornithinimicrobium faecis]|uniref:CaiB/BaiF CoA transferase family protein n=1 Tax=Ornithinimicrobium faecis TaxID=2934158 RepID=UPI00211891D9|nr:CoA transferase [Ornithinimicrobium sp. HY1745]
MTEGTNDPYAGALSGIRVADFSRVLAGPYATMLMADLGADVIKVEPPQGDDTRRWAPPLDDTGRATYFASANRNKRSIVLDLTDPDDLARAQHLATTADVVIDNFRPGVMARFGLDHETLTAANPRVITCAITGFGTGEGAAMPGYDLLVQAMGGLMSVTGPVEGPASKVGAALVDVITGLHALTGTQAALLERERSGRGQRVEVNLLSSLLSGLVNQSSAAAATGVSPQRTGNAHPSIAPYEPLPTGDGEIVLAIGNDRQFQRLAAALGAPGLSEDDRFRTNSDRVAHRDVLREALGTLLAPRSATSWSETLRAAGVPAGPVQTVGEALDLAETLGLHPVVPVAGEGRVSQQVANPITLSRSPAHYVSPPPDLGEHQDALWRDEQRPTAD